MASPPCQNDAEPLFLPITYNNLSTDGQGARAWGIALDVGTPNQTFSLYPSIWDTTVLANVRHCTSKDDLICLAANGGLYDPKLSLTSANPEFSTWNGTVSGTDSSIFTFYNDVIDIPQFNDTRIWGYPFVTDDASLWGISSLGIGPNSTFLQAAVDADAAPSMSWGLWVGSRSIDEPQDGLLMVGGYDNARVAGDFFTDVSTLECPVCLQIQDLSWATENGTIGLTNATTNNFQVSLNPISNSIQIPQELFKAFGIATNGTYDQQLETYTYAGLSPPVGNLSFTIKGGYKTSIPANELFRFHGEYNSEGELVIANDTYQQAFVYSYTNQDTSDLHYTYTWGLPFLTMNYLILDVEQQQFRLSEAIRQDFGKEGGVFPRKLCSDPPVGPGGGGDGGGDGGGTNIGAIVGGVVGGVAGLSLLVLGVFCLWRLRRRRSSSTRGTSTRRVPALPMTYAAVQTGAAAAGYDSRLTMSHPPQGTVFYPTQAPAYGYTMTGHPSSFGQVQQIYHPSLGGLVAQELPPSDTNASELKSARSQRAGSRDRDGSVSLKRRFPA
ncbi:hypothetical protein PV08_08701 [Exophiala spinifera]|uniref:Peptidase A1 domain-containing protein n=1 Tax=Exophiala spinifera TaxID=91928 RepID=A0A0D2B3S1_9EURO|nr:uncharacterized protein PV08_08701 [Exophiala spinifera]KIW13513.1 hypothetical protein PV08_08701 [Exophiala spinifera]